MSSKLIHSHSKNLYILVQPKRSLRNFPGAETSNFLDAKLSDKDVQARINNDEFSIFSHELKNGFSANQIGVNRPVEDRWSAFRLGKASKYLTDLYDEKHSLGRALEDFDGGHLYTVVDGHGGHTCAHAINLLHADYLGLALSPKSFLQNSLEHILRGDDVRVKKACELVEQCWLRFHESRFSLHSTSTWSHTMGPWGSLDSTVSRQHSLSLVKYIEESLSVFDSEEMNMTLNSDQDLCDRDGNVIIKSSDISSPDHLMRVDRDSSQIQNAFLRLDSDITLSAIPTKNKINKSLLRIVLSGCVLSSVYIPQSMDEVIGIQVGDCGIVVGQYEGREELKDPKSSHNVDDFSGELMIPFHNSHNKSETDRLKNGHPIHEAEFLIRDDRLLGELMPFRAFGDIRYKCPEDTLKTIATLLDMPPNYPVIPKYFKSPPYLTSCPQVVCRPLDPINKNPFIILGTDGLWDMVTPDQAVKVVAKHYLDYQKKPWLASEGDSAASRLIKTAFGGEEMSSFRISVLFSVPANIARYYRDDITVIVVYPNLFNMNEEELSLGNK